MKTMFIATMLTAALITVPAIAQQGPTGVPAHRGWPKQPSLHHLPHGRGIDSGAPLIAVRPRMLSYARRDRRPTKRLWRPARARPGWSANNACTRKPRTLTARKQATRNDAKVASTPMPRAVRKAARSSNSVCSRRCQPRLAENQPTRRVANCISKRGNAARTSVARSIVNAYATSWPQKSKQRLRRASHRESFDSPTA